MSFTYTLKKVSLSIQTDRTDCSKGSRYSLLVEDKFDDMFWTSAVVVPCSECDMQCRRSKAKKKTDID